MTVPALSPERPLQAFKWPLRVYYEDTDAGGIVYHSRYLNYMERARTEYLRARGCSLTQLRTEQDMLFVVRRVNISFQRPALFNDALTVSAAISKVAGASLHFHQTVCRDDEQLCAADITVACVSAARHTPKRVPKVLLTELASVQKTVALTPELL